MPLFKSLIEVLFEILCTVPFPTAQKKKKSLNSQEKSVNSNQNDHMIEKPSLWDKSEYCPSRPNKDMRQQHGFK